MDKETLKISSLQNPRIKQGVRLRERRERDRSGLFLIEGYRELLRAIDANRKVETLFICPELFLGTNEQTLIDRIEKSGAQIFLCSEPVFHKLSYRDRPDGLLTIAPQQHLSLNDIKPSEGVSPLLVIAEAIEKPGNLGTILRSSDAVGVDALIVCDRCTDIHNPNVVRASVGTLFTVPVIEAEGKKTIEWVKEQHISILAATPHAEKEYTQVDMTGPIAIAVGTEQLGLSDLWMEHADIQVRIPMFGVADSLNVATATTLLLYEAIRQRRCI
ncbi:MAG: 23S rRNA (uridine(2479)-2'-O)-methyltransferase [Chlamydiae bacterium]|nr:23S rRNA (uridine(2479)-2'-O)-methyltransferase [Chlamydiota bacterium]